MKAISTQIFIPDDYAGQAKQIGWIARESFLRRLGEFKGQDVILTATPMEKSITNQQRNWLRGPFLDQVIAYLVHHCGNEPHTIDRDQLHYDFLSIRFGTVAVASTIPGGQPRIVPARTSSDLTAKEVSDYIEFLARYCAEQMKLVIELPDEYRERRAKELARTA